MANEEHLVPIWIREYVQEQIDKRLSDAPPLTSRADSIPERWDDRHAFYIARDKCGCIVGLVVDSLHTDDVAGTVAEFIRSGLRIERIAADDFNTGSLGCIHHQEPPAAQPDSTTKGSDSHGGGLSPVPPASESALSSPFLSDKPPFASRAGSNSALRGNVLTDAQLLHKAFLLATWADMATGLPAEFREAISNFLNAYVKEGVY